MVNIDKAIKIAKKLDPLVAQTFEADRRNLPESQLIAKLKKFFDDYEKAIRAIEAHPNQNYEQIKQSFDLNVQSHSRTVVHISAFVNDVFNKKADLASLATSAARKIVLSDSRLAHYFETSPAANKIEISRESATALEKIFLDYFQNLKGKVMNKTAIVEELTHKAVSAISEILQKYRQKEQNVN